jgi:tRNA (Thr-GGU) A37 N-methylase
LYNKIISIIWRREDKNKMEINLKPIGYIRTNYNDDSDIPRQSINNMKEKGTIEILDEFKDGIKDIEIGSYIVVLFSQIVISTFNF